MAQRIRIVTKKMPGLEAMPASYSDIHVYVVKDDGTEELLRCVTGITIYCVEPGQPIRAIVKFDDVDVDVEAPLGDLFPNPPKPETVKP